MSTATARKGSSAHFDVQRLDLGLAVLGEDGVRDEDGLVLERADSIH